MYVTGQIYVFQVIVIVILLHKKFLQFYWLRAVVFQLNLKYLPVHVKINNDNNNNNNDNNRHLYSAISTNCSKRCTII